MIKLNLKKISNIINGKLFGNPNLIIDCISINSKEINTKNCLFLAFKGENFNAHQFINESIKNGVIALIVDNYYKNDNNISQIVVKDTNLSFFKISEFIRNKSNACIIAITGSCGKTSVKEMLVNILKQSKYKFSYTKYNNNNNIGVAITLLNIDIKDKFVILEVGMNKLNQIFKSIKLIKPNLFLINNISISHFENLISLKNLINAKGEIFYGLLNHGKFILNYFSNYWNEWKFYFCNINKNPIFFSLNFYKFSDFYATKIKLHELKSKFILNSPIGKKKIKLNLPGLHNISNSIAASSLAISIGIDLKCIKKGLYNFNFIKQRLYPIYLEKNKLILDDTYNSNLESIMSSIKVLSNISGYKVLIIGDMHELGKLSKILHINIKNKIKNFNLDKIISIGNFSKFITNDLINGEYIFDKNILVNKLIKLIKINDKITLLFKASRKVNLNEIISLIINLYKS